MAGMHDRYFWQRSGTEWFRVLNTGKDGLSDKEAFTRLAAKKPARLRKPWLKDLLLLLSQYKSPLVLLLVFAAFLSSMLGEYADSSIVLVVLLLTGLFGFIQERNAGRAVEKLRRMVHNKALVKRDGLNKEIDIDNVVPGDIIILHAGDIVPADALILEATDLHVNEALLTGEPYPVEKFTGYCTSANLSQAINTVFKGTSVVNGTASVLAVHTGNNTEMGRIAYSLAKNVRETSFEKGIRRFGYLLMQITLLISILILLLNFILGKPVIDSLLFVLALAVGIAPELLPAIVTVTLSAGARRMAAKKVIVRELKAIENLGEMDVLCSDKTGTLTEGVIKVSAAVGPTGENSEKVMLYAYRNAYFETGFVNPLDDALRNLGHIKIGSCIKHDEVPYDFIRKRLSVVIREGGHHIMITKGAVANILQCCSYAELPDGTAVSLDKVEADIENLYQQFSSQGFRTIAISYKDVSGDPSINKDDESGMTFLGLVTMSDPPKEGIIESVKQLRQTGVSLKIITGDNRWVAQYVAAQIGLQSENVLTGSDLRGLSTDVLTRKVEMIDLFAEIEPAQKEQIILALQKNGHAVGFLGDGINDANALKVADVGISVKNAVDIAKEAASLVLLEKNMDVIRDGIIEGRKTFMNTLKYIYVTTSANFGNMVSMAAASLFLPFLPLLPVQILLNNFLSDLPALAIAYDKVDEELIAKPRKWDIRYIRRFMFVFGLQSSLFDLLTFILLIFVFHVTPETFRSAWFMESLLTEILILLVIRTQRPLVKSKPSGVLLIAAGLTLCITFILPHLTLAKAFELAPLPGNLLFIVTAVALIYVIAGEIAKRHFMQRL